MRQDHENHINSYMSVDAILTANETLWSGKTGIVANVTSFRDRLTVIQGKRIVAMADTIGQTEVKKNLKKSMAEQTDKVGDVLRAVATKNNDPELFQLAKTYVTDIMRMPDTDAEIRCQQIFNAADERDTALAAEGLDASEIALLESRIGVYHNAINLPRLKEIDIKAANEDLDTLIPNMNQFLKNVLDGNIRALPDNPAHHDFKHAYALARQIIDNAAGGSTPAEPPPAPTPSP